LDFGSAPDLARRDYPALPHTPWVDLRGGATSKGKERKGREGGRVRKERREGKWEGVDIAWPDF